jgi:hypothetical protein
VVGGGGVVLPAVRYFSLGNTISLYVTYRIKIAQLKDGKVHPIRDHEGPEEDYSYSSLLSLTSARDGGGWSVLRPGRFTPGKETRCSL